MISPLMAAFDRAHTLPRALDNVLAQDWADWEVSWVVGLKDLQLLLTNN